MKPVHVAQFSYFAHFCTGFIFCTFLRLNILAKAFSRIRGCKLYKIYINFNRPKRKVIMKEEKKSMAVLMKSMLNMPLGSSLRDIHTFLTSLRICRHAFAFHARKCVKYKYRNPCSGPRTHKHNFADWKCLPNP